MIFTFGAPDLYVLPSDVPSSTHQQKEKQESGSIDGFEEQDILSIKISYCNSYIFILTKRVLFAYSNGNELVYLGRLTLSESGFTEFGNFRDLVILPVPNLFGLLVDNSKHLLVINYQNPNLSESSLSNTPVQTPTNRARYNNTSLSPENNLSSDHSPAHIGPTPLTTTPVTTVNVNKRFSTGNIVNILNRIFRPSDDEVEELRDSFDLYLKNFVKFRLIYDILVPSNFSFMFVVDQQFVFWTKGFSGLYSTISNEGFLNLLINDFNSFKRKLDEVKRINLYLLTTNLLNNVNIIGNIPLSYGLCYINLHSVTINNNSLLCFDTNNEDTNSSNKENKDNEESKNKDHNKNLNVYNYYHSLFQMIYQCVSNIHNTDPNKLVSNTSNNTKKNENPELDAKVRRRSIDADNILDLLEVQNKGVNRNNEYNNGENSNSDTYRSRGVEENLVKNVRDHFIVGNKLYLLSSNLLMYINIHSPEEYENKEDDRDKENKADSSNKENNNNRKEDNKEKFELGRLVYEDVEEVYVNKENELVCVVFKGNKIRTFNLKRLDRVISELELEEEVENVCWLNNFLIVLTVDNYLHFYSYSLQELYSTPVDPSKRGTNQKIKHGIETIRSFSNLSNTSLTNSETCSTYRSVTSTNTNRSNKDNKEDTENNSNKDSSTEMKQDNENKENEESKNKDKHREKQEKDDNSNNYNYNNNYNYENQDYCKNLKKCRLIGINNNLKLLVYNRRLVVYNLYVNYSNVGDFNLFLNSNNILIMSSSCFFSPTKSFGTTFNPNLSKDKRQMFTLKLPSLNPTEKEDSESVDEEQHSTVDDLVIKDIRINKTANYILIHHAGSVAAGGSGSKSNSGIILYDNNKYTFSNNSNLEVLAINWFTNHIFYLVVSIKDDKHLSGKSMVERKKVPFKYYVSFYSINNMNDVLIDIPMKHKPVCTTIDKPYLFIALDECNELHCYDLFYIQYKMLYSFNINKLSWNYYGKNVDKAHKNRDNKDNKNSKENEENKQKQDTDKEECMEKLSVGNYPEFWKEIYVFGYKKFMLLDLYRELYLVDENNIYHLLSNVNQVVLNVSVDRNYQYLVTTRDGGSYLLSNYSENVSNIEYNKNRSNKEKQDKEHNKKDNKEEYKENNSNNKSNYNLSQSYSFSGKGEVDRSDFVMDVVKLMNNTNYILNINNDVMVLLNLSKNNISLIYTLLPVFLTNSYYNNKLKIDNSNDRDNYNDRSNGFEGHENMLVSNDSDYSQLRGREMLLLEYLIYYFNVLGKEVLDVDKNRKENKEKQDKEHNKDNKEDTEQNSNNNNKDKEQNKDMYGQKIYRSKEMMGKINKMMKNKLFSISCRKQNELEKVKQLEKEFDLKTEECFNYLMKEKEYEFASLLLLPLQIKTDPYYVRTYYCKNLIKELLSSIIESTPQTGFKSRRNNRVLILMLIKFYNRLPMNGKVENNREDTDKEDNEENKNKDYERLEYEEKLELYYKARSSQGFGRGIDMVIDMNELIEDLLLKVNFMPVYQLNFLDKKKDGNKDNKNSKENKEKQDKEHNKDNKEDTENDSNNNKDKEEQVPSDPNNYLNYLDHELKDIVESIVKMNTDFEKLALNIVIYFIVEANHINYDIFTNSNGKSPEFYINKYFTEENMKFYMLLGYNNFICLSDLVVNNNEITKYMIKIQESNCRVDEDPKKQKLNILKELMIKTINTYTPYPN